MFFVFLCELPEEKEDQKAEGAVAKVAVFFRALLMFGRQEILSLYGESNEVEEDTWCTPMSRKIMGH